MNPAESPTIAEALTSGEAALTAAGVPGRPRRDAEVLLGDALNVDSMRKVSESINVPIAAGERLYSRYHFRKYIEDQVLDYLQPDIGLAGGLTETKKIATYAETYNLVVAPHNCAGPVATAAAVQLDACMTNFLIQEWFPYFLEDHYGLVTDAFEPQAVDGYFEIPDTPGLGVELSDAVITGHDCMVVE